MKFKYLIYIITISLLSMSCSDFLEGRSNDKTIPYTIQHYKEILMGEIYMKNYNYLAANLNLMTDDVDESSYGLKDDSSDRREKSEIPWFTFARETQIDADGVETIDTSWALLYNMILTCNIIEKEVGDLNEDEKKEKYTLIAEAQVMRAIAYWNLVTMYGEIYKDAQSAKTALGVPINKESGIKDMEYSRAKLSENYALIEKDLLSSIENFNKGFNYNTKFRPNANVARLFLTKLYLNMKQWDKVITYSDEFFANSEEDIVPLEIVKKYAKYGPFPNPDADNAIEPTALFGSNNPGMLFCFGYGYREPKGFSNYGSGSYRFRVSEELRGLYGVTEEEGADATTFYNHIYSLKDIRAHKYLQLHNRILSVQKFSRGYTDFAYRVEEVYFNKGEALIEKGDYKAAISLVNKIRKERINDEDYELKPIDAKEAKQMFRDEKRREFCFEDIRWNDLRRWEIPVTHKSKEKGGGYKTYKLKVGSPNWVLPLPLDIARLGYNMDIIEREDCLSNVN